MGNTTSSSSLDRGCLGTGAPVAAAAVPTPHGPTLADVTVSDERSVAIALTNVGGPYSGKRAKLVTGPDLMVNVCAGTAGVYKLSARYGSTQDGAILGGSMKTIKALFPHVEVVYQMTSAEMIPKETAPTTVPANEAVQFPVVSLGTPQGVVRNKTISPNSKPPEEAVYPAGRLVLIALVVVVLKCSEGGEEEEVALEPGAGVTQDGKHLVLWREVRVPPPFKDFAVAMTAGAPTATVDLPMADTIFAIETQLRKREEFGAEAGPPTKCDSWCCFTHKYNYARERTCIETFAVGKDCETVPPSGKLTLSLVKRPEEDDFQPGTYILRLRGYSLAGLSKWSKVSMFDIQRTDLKPDPHPGQPTQVLAN